MSTGKCTGCRNLRLNLNKVSSNNKPGRIIKDTVLLCDECIERLKIPVQNIFAITGTTDVSLYEFMKKYMS